MPVSSLGIGSGLDVNSIITQLMAIERKPITDLASQTAKIQTQISEVGKISSALSKVRELSTTLSSTTFWQQTSSNSSSSAVGVTSNSSATPASYSIEVQQLASSQSVLAGTTFAQATDLVGSGSLQIEMGAWGAGQSSFTQRTPPATVDITIEATDTVQTLRDKINSSGAGVTASILTDASGARLVMRSRESGAGNGFRMAVAPGSTGAMSTLGFDPSNGVNGATQTTAAANSMATLNGVSVTSATNTMSEVLDGISLTLSAPTTAPVIVEVVSDRETIKKKLSDFAAAYSDLISTIATDTKYDATTKKAGPLQGDGTIVSLQTQMGRLIGAPSTASTAFTRLSDAGFERQRDGSLTVNSTRLDNALTNLSGLRSLFANSNGVDSSADGIARQMRSMADNLLNTDGALTTRKTALSDKLTRNGKSQDRLEERLAQTQKRLERQYGALDTRLSSINALSQYVTQQVAQWSKA